MQLEDDSKDRLLFLWAQATVSASHSEEAATVPGGGRSLRPSVRGTWHAGGRPGLTTAGSDFGGTMTETQASLSR